jgi:hypothetical protein
MSKELGLNLFLAYKLQSLEFALLRCPQLANITKNRVL